MAHAQMTRSAALIPEQSLAYPERYAMIDAWRGLAALAVVVHHVGGPKIGTAAVLIFFVISGYCIAAALDVCQRRGVGFGTFMWRRFRRIYPPYLLAVAFYAFTRLIKWRMTGVNELDRPWWQWLQTLTLTQWLTLVPEPATSAPENRSLFVAAFWSLCYEEQFYLVSGLMMVLTGLLKASVRKQTLVLLVLSLAYSVFIPDRAHGWFIEAWALFAVGSITFHALCRPRSHADRWWLVGVVLSLLAVATVLSLLAPAGHGPFAASDAAPRNAWIELAVACVFAVALLGLRPLDAAFSRFKLLSVPLSKLGLITYSLYLIHQFNLNLVATVSGKAFKLVGLSHPPEWLNITAQCAGHIAMAIVFWYVCERPFLNKSMLPVRLAPSRPLHGGGGR